MDSNGVNIACLSDNDHLPCHLKQHLNQKEKNIPTGVLA